MGYLTEEDIAEFDAQFKSAAAWLRQRQLERETAHLRHISKDYPAQFTAWQAARLRDLEQCGF